MRLDIACALVGVTRPEQLREIAAAAGIERDAQTLAEMGGALG